MAELKGHLSKVTSPLIGFHGKPVMSEAHAAKYLGGVIVEVWASDATGKAAVAHSLDPVGISGTELLQHTVALLPAELARRKQESHTSS